MNIMQWRDALLESPLNYKAKYIGLILSQFYRKNHPTYPSIRALSKLSNLTINPVQEGIALLIKHGFIKRSQSRLTGNKFLSNIYTFINVSESQHVSPGDTSHDTSDDISHDTSDDTSPGDIEIEEIVEIDKKGEEAPPKDFDYLPFQEIAEKNGLHGSHQAKSWKKFIIFCGGEIPQNALDRWEKWCESEYKKPNAVIPLSEEKLTGEKLELHLIGIANWKRDKKMFLSNEERRRLENADKKYVVISWYNYKQWEEKHEVNKKKH